MAEVDSSLSACAAGSACLIVVLGRRERFVVYEFVSDWLNTSLKDSRVEKVGLQCFILQGPTDRSME